VKEKTVNNYHPCNALAAGDRSLTAWASQDGKPVGFDVVDAMLQKNLAFGALLTACNLAFLAWLKKLFFGLPA
jgi:hypothetical protein